MPGMKIDLPQGTISGETAGSRPRVAGSRRGRAVRRRFDGESLEFVDGDQLGGRRQFDRLDVREQAAEGGTADAERLGRLAARVGPTP